MDTSITVLDGGMGKELLRIGAPFQQPEWSAQALMDDPAAVRRAHQNFIDAGSQVITTNAYAVVPFHLGEERFAARGPELAELAGSIARQVADDAQPQIRVAGSLPPLFGSYAPDDFDPARAPGLYEVLVTAQRPFVDVWLGETISSTAELAAVVAAVQDQTQPLWVSFTLDDEAADGTCSLRSGERVGDAVAAAMTGARRLQAVLFNCSHPERMGQAIIEAHAALAGTDVAIGAYANAFVPKEQGYSSNSVILDHRADLTPEHYASIAGDWIDQGASIVGGCCGIRPDHIAALAAL